MRAALPLDWRASGAAATSFVVPSSRVGPGLPEIHKNTVFKKNTPFDRVVLLDFCLLLFNGE
jgi:hypothetical protein